MTGKIARSISPAAIFALESYSDEAITSYIRREHVSGNRRGELCTISVYFGTKLGCNECKQSPYTIKTGEPSVAKLIIKDFIGDFRSDYGKEMVTEGKVNGLIKLPCLQGF